MVDNFWRAQVPESTCPDFTLEDLEKGFQNLQSRAKEGPLHLIRGSDWCDACGWRSLGMWRHGDPREKE